MKLLAVSKALSIWIVPQRFLNPKGIFTRPLLETFKEKYGFIQTPLDQTWEQIQTEGEKFRAGVFAGKNGLVNIRTVVVHSDGIVVETNSSTDDGDAFLADAINFAADQFNLPRPEVLPIRKLYSSELNVQFEKEPEILNPRLNAFYEALSLASRDTVKGEMKFSGFHLGTDYALSTSPAQFKFEREINAPSEDRRYYSAAPMQTEVHIKLIELLEHLAT